MLARNEVRQSVSMLRFPNQLDLFSTATDAVGGTSSGFAATADAEAHQRLLEARYDLLRRAQFRLSGLGLWGFPNMVRNPDGPWTAYRSSMLDLHARLACWPATYILRCGANGIQRFTIRIRPGCDGNLAIPRAAEAMADLAPVRLAPWDGAGDEYEAD